MYKLTDLPKVNLDLLNLFLLSEVNLVLKNSIGELFQNIFDAELKTLDVEVFKFPDGVNPYLFFVGHNRCALDISFPYDKLSVVLLAEAQSKGTTQTSKLIEEHIALQFIAILRDTAFQNKVVPVTFQGLGPEGSFLESDCISLKLLVIKNGEELVCRFNLFVTPYLQLDEDIFDNYSLPNVLVGSVEDVKNKREIKINIFLGVLHLPPSSLVDMLTPKNRIKLPEDFSFEECILILDEEIYFSGALMNQDSGNVFIIGDKIEEKPFDYRSGYSSVYLRVFTGAIFSNQLASNFPYLKLGSNWGGDVELLIGGEFVSRGVLEYGESGLFVIIG